MIGVSEFCKQQFLRTESVCTISPFWGIKSAALTFSTLQTVANVLLDAKKQFWKKDASVYSFNHRTNYRLRLHVHPYFIKYHSLVSLTLWN